MLNDFIHDLFSFDGQSAAVIGGTGVLGFALAKGLARAAAHVIVAGTKEDVCKSRAAELRRAATAPASCQVDVTQRASIENLLAATVQQTGRADILVNCAGVNVANAFLDANDADWDRVMAINLRAVFQGCQVFGRHMADAGGGSIVNIGSVTSHLPLSRVFAYSASKAAVLNLTRNVAREFGPAGRAGKRDLPRLLSRRAEPQDSRSATGRQHHARHAHETLRRAGRTGRRTVASWSRPRPARSSPARTSTWTAGLRRRGFSILECGGLPPLFNTVRARADSPKCEPEKSAHATKSEGKPSHSK